jgi:hypothetical protein
MKIIKPDENGDEGTILASLERHPNIVGLCGPLEQPLPGILVLEWCELGSLDNFRDLVERSSRDYLSLSLVSLLFSLQKLLFSLTQSIFI